MGCYKSILVISLTVILGACGGGNRIDGFVDDPTRNLGDEPPASDLLGKWLVTGELTELSCSGELETAELEGIATTESLIGESVTELNLDLSFDGSLIIDSTQDCVFSGSAGFDLDGEINENFIDDEPTFNCLTGDLAVAVFYEEHLTTSESLVEAEFYSQIEVMACDQDLGGAFTFNYDADSDSFTGTFVREEATGDCVTDQHDIPDYIGAEEADYANQGCMLTYSLTATRVEEDPNESCTGTDSELDPECIDTDGDGFPDIRDNCVTVANEDQFDTDGNGVGDACEIIIDTDSDGVFDDVDNCISVANPTQDDWDVDLIGDACDAIIDTDLDGVADLDDNCFFEPNTDQANADGDAWGDACDLNLVPALPGSKIPSLTPKVISGVLLGI